MFFLSIPTPCHEKWDEMTPNEQGAFCKVCSKTVVDFSALNDEEVKNYFFQNRHQRTCGRFRNDQLTVADNPLPRLLADSIPFWKKFLAIVLVVFSGFLYGCEQHTTGNISTIDEKLKATVGITIPDYEASEMQQEQIPDTSISVISEDVIEGEVTMGVIAPPVIEYGKEIIEKAKEPDIVKEILDENGEVRTIIREDKPKQ